MDISQLAELQRTMERELAALRLDLNPAPAPLKCPDDNELASRLSERAVDERLTARRMERIRDLEDALRRIEVFDYGHCESCGESIPFLRLLAAPSVRLCVGCQQALEDHAEALPANRSFVLPHRPRPVRSQPLGGFFVMPRRRPQGESR